MALMYPKTNFNRFELSSSLDQILQPDATSHCRSIRIKRRLLTAKRISNSKLPSLLHKLPQPNATRKPIVGIIDSVRELDLPRK